MARPKTQKRARDEEDEVASEEEVPKSTKKTVKKAKTTATTAATTGESATDADGNMYWALSNTRRVNLSEFKGKVLINIREYYSDQAGDLKPGRKGISLSLDQYNALLKSIPEISAQLNEDGHETVEIPSAAPPAPARPSSSSSSKSKSKESKKPKEKPKKSNIEATSDEDEEEDE